ncbi:Protein FAM222B [Liparis tanakae]|uniref:Protein FAM222B n=1 Tax=Liparis tanakae TaxID=230148 RepID=A0A4Z2IJ21_9TELE|nr:Protein FAM222B [Liparis tanakae]
MAVCEGTTSPRGCVDAVVRHGETTQKMRSASYPTPAELDAFAKKVANNPLSIQIFPNSVKVPQRKHIRRTVNGLDTSSSSQRHSPYPSQVSSSRGLLAVLRAPAKGVVKESDGSRARHLQKAAMNPHSGPYAAQSTLNLPQPAPHLQGPTPPGAQKQGMNRQSDLSSIVHQINQLCQARAGMGNTSVCEGQIANPGPISRNLLINASSRVSCHHPALGSVPSCHMSFTLKHPSEKALPSSPSNCPVGSMPYNNGHYMQPPWGAIPATAGNNGSGPQDLPVAFQGGHAAAAANRIPGAKYRPGKEGPSDQPKLMQNVDFLGGDFQMPNYQEQNMGVMEKMHRSAIGQVQEPNNGGGAHPHHPGYR